MRHHREQHRRRSIRLKGYDYSQPGVYFITICTHRMEYLFGHIVKGKMNLSSYGKIVQREWQISARIRAEIDLDIYQVMPNHFHGIVIIQNKSSDGCIVGANGRSPLQMKPKSLSSLLAGFKAATALKINKLRNKPGTPVWQRSYYEHIVRDEGELNLIRDYIMHNPLKWHLDRYNPDQ